MSDLQATAPRPNATYLESDIFTNYKFVVLIKDNNINDKGRS